MVRRLNRSTWFAILLAWVVLAAAVAAESPRIVEVEFQVKAPEFSTNLKKTLHLLHENVAEELARLGCEHFGFVRWEPASTADDRLRDAKLIVALAEDGGDVYLTFESYPRHTRIKLFNTAYDPLYRYYDKPPTGNRAQLECDLIGSRNTQQERKPCRRYLPRLFENRDFRDRLLREFLSEIAIASELILHRRRLLLPVDEKALAAHDGCKLKAEFETRIDDHKAGLCRLLLEKNGSYRGAVRTEVQKTDFDYLDPFDGWLDDIPEALDHQLEESLGVFVIEDYETDRSSGTTDRLEMDLNPNIGVCTPRFAPR